MIILTIYLTGLAVCFIYDMTLLNAGYNPYGKLKSLGKILDVSLWPLTLISAFILSIVYKEKLQKENKNEKTSI